jgi:hypothetical protein
LETFFRCADWLAGANDCPQVAGDCGFASADGIAEKQKGWCGINGVKRARAECLVDKPEC